MGRAAFVRHDVAVELGRALVARALPPSDRVATSPGLFSVFSERAPGIGSTPVFALSSTVHAGVLAFCVFMAAFNLTPRAASLGQEDKPADLMHLVFLNIPGPGGGGGGGGLQQKAAPPKALREGHHTMSSPLPVRRDPPPVAPTPAPPEPKPAPPLKA